MKTIILFTCLLWLFVSQAKAQIPPPPSVLPPPPPVENTEKGETLEQIYTVVQQQAQFKGGQNALVRYMQKNYKQPRAVQRLGITGKVFVKFVVTKEGKVAQAEVTRGIENCPECNEEALRLIKMMPDWEPGLQNGKPVSVYFVMPISFKMTEDGDVKEASFKGGLTALNDYIQTNLEYPKKAKKKKIEGQITMGFTVEETGEITNPIIISSMPNCPLCEEEAKRLVKAMPAWEAKTQDGKPQKSIQSIVIAFKLPKK